MNNMNPMVSVIILNFNGGQDVIECLTSVMEIDYTNFEIIVVDNGSTDNSVKEIQSKFPGVKIINNKNNLGFPGGNNAGIQGSTAPYVLLLNDDVVVGRSIIKDLVAGMQNHPGSGIAGPAILYYKDPERIWAAGARVSSFGYTAHIGKGHKYAAGLSPQNVDYITGCAMLIKREVIDKIGLMDPDYFLYYDDADYCYRASKAGFDSLYVPSPTVRHKTSAEWITNPVQAYYYMKSASMFARKNLTGINKYTFITSQIVFMFPYYSFKMIGKDFKIFKGLVRGLKDGILYRPPDNAKPDRPI